MAINEYTVGDLTFKYYEDDGKYWGIHEGIEYCVYEIEPGKWFAVRQRRLAQTSVSQGMGCHPTLEQAIEACREFLGTPL